LFTAQNRCDRPARYLPQPIPWPSLHIPHLHWPQCKKTLDQRAEASRCESITHKKTPPFPVAFAVAS
ncbi:hypothetical protein, partial [Xanthomonas hortorum]|uniref:hypothetical protein n=1 Tax=Xanthomonas hortorum TaxID=56454 RepID=UPI003CCFA1EA